MQRLRMGTLFSIGTAALLALSLSGAEKYTGPRPPKADIPYLLHADSLIQTEVGESKEDTRKDGRAYVLPGVTSSARTPLSEPIFLIKVEKLVADKLALYPLQVKNGAREVYFPTKLKKDSTRPLHTVITRVAEGLYRLEANEALENGQYALSPDGSNQVFAFEVY